MQRFAKIFEGHGRQILFRVDKNSDGDPAVLMEVMDDEGASVTLGVSNNEADDPKQWVMDTLDLITEDQAMGILVRLEGKTNAFEIAAALQEG